MRVARSYVLSGLVRLDVSQTMGAVHYRKVDGRDYRSLADALEHFRKFELLQDDDEVEIRACSWPLPDGRHMGFVWIIGLPDTQGSIPVIEMPSAGHFVAKTTKGETIRA